MITIIALFSYILQATGDRCDTTTPVGILNTGGDDTISSVRINFQLDIRVYASVAVKVEQFSFVFVSVHVNSLQVYQIRGVSD